MKISHSLMVHISANTYITSYNNSESQSCSFIEDGETITLSFGTDSLQKLNETIQNLQQIYQSLCLKRQQQISKELDLINPKPSFISTQNGNGKNYAEVDIQF
ncbi:hypothetical protein G7B40_025150 [Aetokthonos hydrillicola Thurmond2011]|jgi:hypothetical protein|uniref:Uncharacterized protein n=1 Tax=Aetokthonos hydrillicola Thurmond2011 TaxID=2712845 RepID=A0AAP5IF38_9CYAN|nr:hypothetical protein [Aetokthonos hydrillicola]MBO3458456.1 hypothetical protein [Aetokthonos hydrillicola CCALA 1050]MBW4586217.1 hypothetical protein [Aetokthonos hydrillicola CCALA 1050]MDR9897825.1 hypothetical protein [Aetokthonos hydrillicola Thurmond2011]